MGLEVDSMRLAHLIPQDERGGYVREDRTAQGIPFGVTRNPVYFFFSRFSGTPNRPPPTCVTLLFNACGTKYKKPCKCTICRVFAILFVFQRRERDSNPRYSCPYTAFRVRPDRPLRHLQSPGTKNLSFGTANIDIFFYFSAFSCEKNSVRRKKCGYSGSFLMLLPK